jgi:hypothetical protein
MIDQTKNDILKTWKLSILLVKTILAELNAERILQAVIDATTQLTGAAFGAFFYNKVTESGESYVLYTISGASKSDFENFGMPSNTEVFSSDFYRRENCSLR